MDQRNCDPRAPCRWREGACFQSSGENNTPAACAGIAGICMNRATLTSSDTLPDGLQRGFPSSPSYLPSPSQEFVRRGTIAPIPLAAAAMGVLSNLDLVPRDTLDHHYDYPSSALSPSSVICAYPLSGQYGPGTRYLYYGLVAICIFARREEWLREPCLAAALLFPALASIHAIVLACYSNVRKYHSSLL